MNRRYHQVVIGFPMREEDFFKSPEPHSKVKINIVSQYFYLWSKTIVGLIKKGTFNFEKIVYLDLFSGPGIYEDGFESSPLRIIRTVIENDDLSYYVQLVFNDSKREYIEKLKKKAEEIVGYKNLRHKPHFSCEEIGINDGKADIFSKRILGPKKLPPTLLFIDPFGYKGISIDVVSKVVRNIGSDVIFFFNFLRINRSISADVLRSSPSLYKVFGDQKRTHQIFLHLERLEPHLRKKKLLEELKSGIKDAGGEYVLEFFFKDAKGTRANHHLIFTTKSKYAFSKMKEIMRNNSSTDGLPITVLGYNPIAEKFNQLFLGKDQPIIDLAERLMEKYSGKTLTMSELFFEDQWNTLYIEGDYKESIRYLEKEGKINCDPPVGARRKHKGLPTLGKSVMISFPEIP